MTNYADAAYYSDIYKGAVIDTASFNVYAMRSTQVIKVYTFNRIDESSIQDEVKMCCCEVAEYIFKTDPLNHNGISSEKVGEYSVTYEKQTDIDNKLECDMKKIIYRWLATTDLLYRGC